MTKQQLKEKYDEWNRETGKLSDNKDDIFHELQDLCAAKCGHRSCCLQTLIEELVKAGEAWKALDLAERYWKAEGQEEALRNLAVATNNFEI